MNPGADLTTSFLEQKGHVTMPVATASHRLVGPHRPRSFTQPRRYDHATHLDFGVRPFIAIRCARCKAGLHDQQGLPRWDIVGLTCEFVCQGGCRGGKGGN